MYMRMRCPLLNGFYQALVMSYSLFETLGWHSSKNGLQWQARYTPYLTPPQTHKSFQHIKNGIVYKHLTCTQLLTMCVENIPCV